MPAEKLLTVEEARSRVLAAIGGPTQPELIALSEARGRVLAEDVVSPIDLPPWDNSAMDGYALRSADTTGASETAPTMLAIVGDVAAGQAPEVRVGRGSAVRIATGAKVPPGADAVVPVEQTMPGDANGSATGGRSRDAGGPLPPTVLITEPVAPGFSIRSRGSDLRAGARVLDAGTLVTPAAIAVAAGVGAANVSVRRRPVVGVLATGDEVRAPGQALGDAGIPDANGPALMALVEEAGGDARWLGIAADRLEDVRARLCAGLTEEPDVVIVSGGVSVGPYDHVRAAFAEVGQVDLWRVAVQPGKPFAFATERDRGVLLFGLPGNPVSTFVTFELFVRPALLALLGRPQTGRPRDRGVLLDEARTSRERRAYLRVTAERDAAGAPLRDDAGRVRLRLSRGPAGQGSHVLSALAAADALAIVPEGIETHAAGDPVDLWWLDAR